MVPVNKREVEMGKLAILGERMMMLAARVVFGTPSCLWVWCWAGEEKMSA